MPATRAVGSSPSLTGSATRAPVPFTWLIDSITRADLSTIEATVPPGGDAGSITLGFASPTFAADSITRPAGLITGDIESILLGRHEIPDGVVTAAVTAH